MAGTDGRPLRRSHTKSRTGCETCKRRHVRCDEVFPQCRNCTKYKVHCPYNDVKVPDAGCSTTQDIPDLMWTPEIEAAIAEWQTTGDFPFPSLHVHPAPIPHLYSAEDLRLIYHLAKLYHQLSEIDANKFTLWTHHIPTLLRIGATTPYVMKALVAFSATHIAYLTDCPLVGRMAFEHRGIALSGLHDAIGTFSRETSDAIFAASLVLSWQAPDWYANDSCKLLTRVGANTAANNINRPSWTQFMQGISTVVGAMDVWKHESQFGGVIAETSTFLTALPPPDSDHRPTEQWHEDIQAFQRALEQVQKVESHLRHHKEETPQVQHVIGFLKDSRKISPTLSIAQQYERLQSLRTWLFWMPIGYLQDLHGSVNSLVVIAHLYAIALLMERLFPEIGAAYFGSLCISPIEEIGRRLMFVSVAGGCEGDVQREFPLTLLEFPINTLSEFCSRMGWVHADGTPPFPQFHPLNLLMHEKHPMATSAATSPHYMPYSNVAFSNIAVEMSLRNSAAIPGNQAHYTSPLMLPLPFSSQYYLNAPSPSYGSAARSPVSSTFEGSVPYSDTEEYGSYDTHKILDYHI